MWVVYAILGALFAGIAITLTKAGIKEMEPSLVFALQSILILCITWAVVFFSKQTGGIQKIEKPTWLFILGSGVATTLASLFQFKALKSGDASAVAPIDRLSLVFALVLAVFFLKEKINWQVIAGAVLIVGGGVLIALNKQSS